MNVRWGLNGGDTAPHTMQNAAQVCKSGKIKETEDYKVIISIVLVFDNW